MGSDWPMGVCMWWGNTNQLESWVTRFRYDQYMCARSRSSWLKCTLLVTGLSTLSKNNAESFPLSSTCIIYLLQLTLSFLDWTNTVDPCLFVLSLSKETNYKWYSWRVQVHQGVVWEDWGGGEHPSQTYRPTCPWEVFNLGANGPSCYSLSEHGHSATLPW